MKFPILLLSFALMAWGCQPTVDSSSTEAHMQVEGGGHHHEGHDQEENDHAEHGEEGQEHGHHHGHANKYMNQKDFDELAAGFEEASRVEWQRPEEVIRLLGDLKDKTIMDLGAGTGYFAFRLQQRGTKVIAADVDQRFLDYMDSKRSDLSLDETQLELRKVDYDDPKIEKEELDLFFTVDTYHHLENRSEYFPKVMAGLKPGGKAVIVDFKKMETPHGPPARMRISTETIVAELEAAGFQNVTVNQEILPEQFIIIGEK